MIFNQKLQELIKVKKVELNPIDENNPSQSIEASVKSCPPSLEKEKIKDKVHLFDGSQNTENTLSQEPFTIPEMSLDLKNSEEENLENLFSHDYLSDN